MSHSIILRYIHTQHSFFKLRALYQDVHTFVDPNITLVELTGFIADLVKKGVLLRYTCVGQPDQYIYNYKRFKIQ